MNFRFFITTILTSVLLVGCTDASYMKVVGRKRDKVMGVRRLPRDNAQYIQDALADSQKNKPVHLYSEDTNQFNDKFDQKFDVYPRRLEDYKETQKLYEQGELDSRHPLTQEEEESVVGKLKEFAQTNEPQPQEAQEVQETPKVPTIEEVPSPPPYTQEVIIEEAKPIAPAAPPAAPKYAKIVRKKKDTNDIPGYIPSFKRNNEASPFDNLSKPKPHTTSNPTPPATSHTSVKPKIKSKKLKKPQPSSCSKPLILHPESEDHYDPIVEDHRMYR